MDAPVPLMDGAPVEAMADVMADAADAELSDALADIQAIDPSFDPATMEDPILANMEAEVPELHDDQPPVVSHTTAAGMAMGGQVTYITDIHNLSDEEYNKLISKNDIPIMQAEAVVEDDGYRPLTEERFKSMAADIERNAAAQDAIPGWVSGALAVILVVGLLVVVVGLAGAM